jgi:hypothetical protein
VFKKILQVVALLSLSISLTLIPQGVRAAEPQGIYSTSGPMALRLNVPGIINISVRSPDVGVLGGLLGFAFEFNPPANAQNNFVMTVNNPLDSSTPIKLHGSWSMLTASRFRVEMNFQDLAAMIEQRGGKVAITRNSFTGRVLANGDIKGAYALGVRISIGGSTIRLRLSGSYIGKPGLTASSQIGEVGLSPGRSPLSATSITMEQFIADLLEKIRQQSIQ